MLRDQAVAAAEDVPKWEAAQKAMEVALREELGEGGRSVRLAALRGEVESGLFDARRDRALVDSVADVRVSRQDLGSAGADYGYARAFRDAGLDLDVIALEQVGRVLKARPPSVVLAVSAALDDWAFQRRSGGSPRERWSRPLVAARAADSDPFRDKVRAAVLDTKEKSREAALRALAAAPDAGDLPPASAVLLASSLRDLKAVEPAVALLRTVAGRHPDDMWVNYALAASLELLRPSPGDEVVRYYSAARSIRPETAHELAHVLERMGHADDALTVFRDLVTRRPGDTRVLVCYGLCLRAHGRREAEEVLDRAVDAGREAIRVKPDDSDSRFILGYALSSQGKLDEAVAAYHVAIRLNPDDAIAYSNLGVALGMQGKFDEAVAACREAIRLEPANYAAYTNLGKALDSPGKGAEALAAWREAIRLEPNYAVAHNNLGVALRSQGKLDEAVIAYREAIRVQPDYATGYRSLGNALLFQGKPEEAVIAYREAIRLKPDFAEATRQSRQRPAIPRQAR